VGQKEKTEPIAKQARTKAHSQGEKKIGVEIAKAIQKV